MAQRKQHSRSHEDRKEHVRKQFPRIHKDFHALYNASMDFRYEPMDCWLSPEIVQKELVEKRLANIRSFADSPSRGTGK